MPSPRPGFSTLTTSAPRSPSSDVHHGPAAWCERSMTRMPASAARRSVMLRLLPASASPRPRALTLLAGSCLGGRMAARLELPADHPHVAVVTTDRPAQANALDPPTLRDLAAAWRAVAADPEIRCAVLTGAGERVFCAGMDMKTTIPAAQRFARGERIEPEVFEGLRSVATALLAGFDLGTPLVCAVNGHARAGGFDLMLAAEIRYAVPEATFALEEVALGLYPTGNATVLLPRQIPWVHAHELLLTARPIDARRALEIGLVNRVVARDRLMATALETADAIAANAPLAVRETCAGCYSGYGSDMSRSIFCERRGMRPLATRWGWLEGYRLCFDLPIGPGERAVANVQPQAGARTCGVLYLLDPGELDRLDRSEGVPRGFYRRIPIEVVVGGEERVAAFTYQSSWTVAGRKPSARYLGLLVAGAREHGLPAEYVRFLESHELARDERQQEDGEIRKA